MGWESRDQKNDDLKSWSYSADNPSAPVYSRIDMMETLRNRNGSISLLTRIPAMDYEGMIPFMENPFKDGVDMSEVLGQNYAFEQYALVDDLVDELVFA